MKILQTGKFYPIRGGVEKVMWDLTRGLCEKGVDCDMLCAMLRGDGFDEADRDRGRIEGRNRIIDFGPHGRCICVPAFAKVAATMLSPAMVFWMMRHAKEYDIIHVHHPDPMACMALWFSRYKGKVVLHWHSDILKQKGILFFYRPFQSWLVRRADRIIGTTPAYVAASQALAKVQHKISVLPIGIEDNVRSEAPDSRTDGVKTVFSLGRLVEYKGFRYLVEAARHLPPDYRIVIGGKGPLMDELKALYASAEGLGAAVEFAGYMSDSQVRGMYNSCSLFVLPSVMKTEAFGIVQIEAMSCGKPVVATRIPGSGTAWVNEDGVSGINVDICDPQGLADAIVAVCSDPQRYSLFCRAARERFENCFTLSKMIDGAVAIYESVLQ